MASEYTFSIIKPDTVKNGLSGKILEEIESNGFTIASIRKIKITPKQAEEFYISLKDKPFFNDLVKYMSSGEVIIMVLKKDNAVVDFRELIGATDPAQARIGTLRKKYGYSKESNAIHGSDSDESAEREIKFFDL
jgi:nucleoside-diphosphate kinase